MVFCCIAIIALAIIYFIALWIRQIFSWPTMDKTKSKLPAPPRALTGHGAMPVYGHTSLFNDRAGDCALLFQRTDRSIKWLPQGWTRPLGDCFAMFLWGRWRVVIKGPTRCEYVLKSQELKESWPWSPPITLLSKSCFDFLDNQEIENIRRLLGRPLSHRQVLLYAPQFALHAEACISDICAGTFRKKQPSSQQTSFDQQRRPTATAVAANTAAAADTDTTTRTGRAPARPAAAADLDDSIHEGMGGYTTEEDGTVLDGIDGVATFKVKWEAFRSYTFDLVNGPVLGLNLWNQKASTTATPLAESTGDRSAKDVECGLLHPLPSSQRNHDGNNKTTETSKKKKKQRKKKKNGSDNSNNEDDEDDGRPCRETMLLYMERIKRGVDVIKTTFGPEWMYIWILNEYGRALNARMHVEEIMRRHVAEVAQRDPAVKHPLGHPFLDPTTQAFPLLTMRENLLRSKEGIFGDSQVQPCFATGRPRSRSMPGNSTFLEATSSDDEAAAMYESGSEYIPTISMEQDLARARPRTRITARAEDLEQAKQLLRSTASAVATSTTPLSSSTCGTAQTISTTTTTTTTTPRSAIKKATSQSLKSSAKVEMFSPQKEWRRSMQDQLAKLDSPTDFLISKQRVAAMPQGYHDIPEKPLLQSKKVTLQEKSKISMLTVLERIMKQHDIAGNGLSQVVTSDIAILLWMMLEVGNAWTAMALTLISADPEALALVQQELDDIENTYGRSDMFSPSALSRMKYLDALLYEAIRLCPANIGGMKMTTETMEMRDAGVQIPKGTNIFFCRPTDMIFDIHGACGKKPENLGRLYPSVELHGFLPLQGMEVPLMVLQSKVFLICMLQKFAPVVSKKKTFIRRVRTQVKDMAKSFRSKSMVDSLRRGEGDQQSKCQGVQQQSSFPGIEGEECCEWPPQPDFMEHFTKTPFPEPRRVIKIRPRTADFQSQTLSI